MGVSPYCDFIHLFLSLESLIRIGVPRTMISYLYLSLRSPWWRRVFPRTVISYLLRRWQPFQSWRRLFAYRNTWSPLPPEGDWTRINLKKVVNCQKEKRGNFIHDSKSNKICYLLKQFNTVIITLGLVHCFLFYNLV